jgi:PAS domain-containing protein
VLAETERGLKRSGLHRKTSLALTPIRPTRERYDRAVTSLFAAADQHRRDGTPRTQRRQDTAWAATDRLGDELDQLSRFLARAIASRGRALQDSIDARNQWIIAVVTSLALLVGVLVLVIQTAVGRAKIIAEANRVRAEELLEENQSILDGAGEGILGVDSEGVITFVNPAGSRMTGYESTS